MDPLLQRALEIANRPRPATRQPDVIRHEDTIIEPAHPTAKPVYFLRNDGVIHGPATVTNLAKVGSGETATYWVIVEFQGQASWVRSDRLRTRKQFEAQHRPQMVEFVKEPR
ncbi:MAG: hypothetical protein CAF45_007850 [Nitrospira sp. CG24E]|mgnify:CR=1 FL=1|nr:MAG: hypothetical protein CAF45_007850 [Nitrospira sp. CG24E]